jgi:hypothetical protein
MSITISKPNQANLNQSIALILSADQKTALTADQITSGKRINEQEAYAVLVHDSLNSTNPKLAKRFEQELKEATAKYKENHNGEVNMHKISDRLMRQYKRENEVNTEQYRAIRDHSFGNAQLDSNRTQLSGARPEDAIGDDTPVRAVSTFYKKLETNQAATSEEIAVFRANEAKISAEKFQEKKISGANATTGAAGASADSVIKGVKDVGPGFLWKPQSESNGNLVVLLPPNFTSSVNSLTLKDPKGSAVLESGKYAGIGNGGRLHFRFGKGGSNYPDGTIVEVKFTDGSTMKIPIKETSARVES